MAMSALPHVAIVRDLSEGAGSAQFPGRLPNGWTPWVAFRVTSDHEGIRTSLELTPRNPSARKAPGEPGAGRS